VAIFSGAGVNQVIAPDHLGVGIGKKWKSVTGLLRKVARYLRTVDADRNGTNSGFFELVQILLNAP
jgi:hypothetical protein